MLETSWAINISDAVGEGSCILCGTKAGIALKNNDLSINKVDLNQLVVTDVDTSAGGVAFYEGESLPPQEMEAKNWIDAVINDKEPVVKPEEAYVVSQILEAIYTSSKTKKPVYFE